MKRVALIILFALTTLGEVCAQQPDLSVRDLYLLRKAFIDSVAVPSETPPPGRVILFGRGKLGIFVKFCDGTIARLDSGGQAGSAGVADSLKNLRNPTGLVADSDYVYAKSGQWVMAKLVGTANGYVVYDSSGTLVNAFPRNNPESAWYALPALDVDWGLVYHSFRKSISTNSTFTFSNLVDGKWVTVAVTATGAYTCTWPTVTWMGGTAPTQTASKTDFYRFVRMNGVTYGWAGQNF